MDAAYNLAQAMTDLAEMLEDLEGDARAEEIRRLREEARTVLEMVLQGQEEYLRLTTEAVDVEAAEEAVDEVEGGAEMDMDDPPGDEGDATTTYETHLPTPSALLDTALALIDIHLSLWESTVPSRTPTNSEQSVVRSVLDRAAATTPPGRQAELDLAEIKVLLSMDGIVWDLFKSEARIGTGVEKSLEGAVAALEALLTSLDVYPPDEQTVRTDILTTLADTHSTIASRLLFLTPQLPPGPSPLAQQAWFHFSQAVTRLSTALDLPTSASTPRLFKTSVLLSLSKASLSRVKLAELNETAQRNASQLMENATTYSARASEALGRNATTLPYPAGWVAELIARNTALQQLRVCFYGSKPDLVADAKERYASRAVGILERLKGVRDEERRVRSADVERWITEIQEEGGMEDEEREWWKEVAAGLGE